MITNKTDKAWWVYGLSTALLLVLYAVCQETLSLPRDGEAYLEMADLWRTGAYFSHDLTLIRGPLYPTLLALFRLLSGGYFGAVVALHTFIGVVAVLSWIRVASRSMPPFVAMITISFSFTFMYPAFSTVLTEWTAFCLLWIALSRALKLAQDGFRGSLRMLSLLATLLMLNHPSYLPAIFSAFVVLFVQVIRVGSFKMILLQVTQGGALILFWAGVVFLRTGAFTLYPFGGFASLASATLIGNAYTTSEDPSSLREFIEYINSRKVPQFGHEDFYLKNLPVLYFSSLYDYNVWKVALPYKTAHSLSWSMLNAYSLEYTKRVVTHSPSIFLYYLLVGLGKYWECLCAFVVLAIARIVGRIGTERDFYFCFTLILTIHVTKVLLAAATVGLLPRYFYQTGSIFYALLIPATWFVCKEIFSSGRKIGF